MNRKQKSQTKGDVVVRTNHPLVGAWAEEDNHFHTSTVVFTITALEGLFSVSGIDESDGVTLRISGTRWDGGRLHFTSLFPPTKHKASHVFSLIGQGRASHIVSYTDEDGSFTANEVWKKKRRKPSKRDISRT